MNALDFAIVALAIIAWLAMVAALAIITGGNNQPPERPLDVPPATTIDPSSVWQRQAEEGRDL